MIRRNFLKLLGAAPLAPSVLMAAESVIEKPDMVKFEDFPTGCGGPVALGDGTVYIDYYKVMIENGKTHLEIRYKLGHNDWKVLKRTYANDSIRGFWVWAHVNCYSNYYGDSVEFCIPLYDTDPDSRWTGVRLS